MFRVNESFSLKSLSNTACTLSMVSEDMPLSLGARTKACLTCGPEISFPTTSKLGLQIPCGPTVEN